MHTKWMKSDENGKNGGRKFSTGEVREAGLMSAACIQIERMKFVIRLERIDRPGESWCKMNGQMLVKRDNCEMPGNTSRAAKREHHQENWFFLSSRADGLIKNSYYTAREYNVVVRNYILYVSVCMLAVLCIHARGLIIWDARAAPLLTRLRNTDKKHQAHVYIYYPQTLLLGKNV